jgi:hypothetical protein
MKWKERRRKRRSSSRRKIGLFITTANKKNEYENMKYILFPSHTLFY